MNAYLPGATDFVKTTNYEDCGHFSPISSFPIRFLGCFLDSSDQIASENVLFRILQVVAYPPGVEFVSNIDFFTVFLSLTHSQCLPIFFQALFEFGQVNP